MRIKKSSIILSFLLVATIILSGCSSAPSEKGEGGKAPEAKTKTVASSDKLIEISIPEGWKETDQLNDIANIQVANISKEQYTITLSESKADFSDSFTLKDYYDVISGNMASGIQNAELSEPKEITINRQKALQFKLTGELDKIKVAYLTTVIESEDNFHQIISWTLQSKYDEYQKIYEEIANSFKEL